VSNFHAIPQKLRSHDYFFKLNDEVWNKKRQLIVLTACIIIVGLISECSGRDEKHREGQDVHLKNYTKKNHSGNAKLEFYDELKKTLRKKPREDSEGLKILMHTLKPEDDQRTYYRMGECIKTVFTDLDGNNVQEKICPRCLKYKEYDVVYTYVSLVLDIFKDKKQILRQELDRGFFFEERFVELKDVNGDGKAELITRVCFSPDCAGCSSYRIYTFEEDRFDLTLNLFKIDPDNPAIKNVLRSLSGFEEMILKDHREKTKSEHPCKIWDSRIRSDPLAVDVDHDGQPEVVLLPGKGTGYPVPSPQTRT